ncbi:MAG: CpsD/CapB family tyrosine-protein kinase [Candidatus Omnitrophica bacterium]|nr:CpsD/CapB family tyrosine-protein kinase [Candidatus Omnitrophota bacterium]
MGLKDNFFRIKVALQEYKQKLLDEIGPTTYIVKKERTDDGIDSRVVVYSDPKSHIAEQYRIMRTNLRSLSPDKPLRSFAITSSLRGEGKTVTTSNIALSFAQEPERKVLLVDTDLRKPGIHKMFGITKEPGLVEVLLDEIDVERFLSQSVLPNLYIIPSGKIPPNPSELLSSKKLKELIIRWKEQFDYLFFDCPPIIPVTDAGVLGSQVDGTILVVKAASTGALDVERAFSLLKEANVNLVGAVLSNVVTYIPYYLYRYRYIYVDKY